MSDLLEASATSQMIDTRRQAGLERKTTETRITLRLDVDGTGQYRVATGIRFFDHMLESFTKHGGFDLELTLRGRSGTWISTIRLRTSALRWEKPFGRPWATSAAFYARATSSCQWMRPWPFVLWICQVA